MSCSDIPATLIPLFFLSCITRKKMMIFGFVFAAIFFSSFVIFYTFDYYIISHESHDLLG